jgi:hypothetical protein
MICGVPELLPAGVPNQGALKSFGAVKFIVNVMAEPALTV